MSGSGKEVCLPSVREGATWMPEGVSNYLHQVHCLGLLKPSPEQGQWVRGMCQPLGLS